MAGTARFSRIDRAALAALEFRFRTMLPDEYQETYEAIAPTPMGSAPMKYAADGSVAWNEIWGGFCTLAMAGGPPHKGALLEPATPDALHADPDRYGDVVDEICRGIELTTQLPASPAPVPGWVRVECLSGAMARWLLRAITMENVAVHREGAQIDLPAAPAFRVEKEIKNVITVIAKTCHYWLEHLPRSRQRDIAALFDTMDAESPLIEPVPAVSVANDADHERLAATVAAAIDRAAGLTRSPHRYTGWLGVVCPDVAPAVWMMRMLLASNVLSRREGAVLFVPLHPVNDPDGARVTPLLARVHALARGRGVLAPAGA